MPRPLLIACLLALVAGLCCVVVWSPGNLSASTDNGSNTNADFDADQQASSGGGRQPSRTEIGDDPVEEEVIDSAPVRGGVVLGDRVLSGRVIDAEYEPVAEAWVLTAEEGTPVLTEEDGSFEIPLGPDRYWWTFSREIIAWKDGRALTRKSVRQTDGILMVLKEDEGVKRKVIDGDSQMALPGAEARILVEVESDTEGGFFNMRRFVDLPLEVAPADDDGNITIPDPEKSQRFAIEVKHPDYEPVLTDWWSVRRDQPIRLSQPTEIKMQFVDSDGKPHAGAQLGFPWTRRILTLDAEGWVNLPPEARWGLWSVQLVTAEQRWIFLEIEEDQIYDGGAVATNAYPRLGKLQLEGSESPALYEVATSSQWQYWKSYEPDPSDNPEALIWTPVVADGTFTSADGWQADHTGLHVRKIGERRILHSEELVGEGPYEIALAAASLLKVLVHADPPEVLTGAALELIGQDDGSLTSAELGEGAAEIMLTNGQYELRLQLAGHPHKYPLGEIEILGKGVEHEFWFEGVHTLTGSVTAGGEAVFPCQLDLRSDNGFRTSVDTDPKGNWSLDGAPHQEIYLRVRPEDDWIEPVTGIWALVGPYQDQVYTDIPVARLLVTVGNYPEKLLDKITARREAPSGSSRGYRSGRSSNSSTNAKLPDLREGPAELRLAPGVVRFRTRDNDMPLADTRIEIRANEVAGFVVSTPPVGRIATRIEGLNGQLWGNVDIQPVNVPLSEKYPTFVAGNGSRPANANGMIGNPRVLLPGRYKVRMHNQIWSRDLNGQLGGGEASIEIEIGEGDWKEAVFHIGDDGTWQAPTSNSADPNGVPRDGSR